jgi:hypothetical protein
MKMNNRLLILLLLLSPITASAQARSSTGEVRQDWLIKNGVRSSFRPLIGKFQAPGKEGETIHSFRDTDTKSVVTAGIVYGFDHLLSSSKLVPYRIRLGITVSDNEAKEVFDTAESVEASTRYDKNWNLAVSKRINYDNRS